MNKITSLFFKSKNAIYFICLPTLLFHSIHDRLLFVSLIYIYLPASLFHVYLGQAAFHLFCPMLRWSNQGLETPTYRRD